MKFLIQKIDNQIRHDFAFTLLEAMRFRSWLSNVFNEDAVKYLNTKSDDTEFKFKPMHRKYIPIGSVEFVSAHLNHFYGLTPSPINVPKSLYPFAHREIFIGTNMDLECLKGKWFVKSMDKIKGLSKEVKNPNILSVPPGNERYQISEYISIDSEWRAFVYRGKLEGLQHYAGEFTMFPDVQTIKKMIEAYKDSPIAYTLDIGVKPIVEVDSSIFNETFVIEVHDFFSCGLYGFSDVSILPRMFYMWFNEYINKNKI